MQNCYFLLVGFADFANLSVIEEKNLLEYKKYNGKKINIVIS